MFVSRGTFEGDWNYRGVEADSFPELLKAINTFKTKPNEGAALMSYAYGDGKWTAIFKITRV